MLDVSVSDDERAVDEAHAELVAAGLTSGDDAFWAIANRFALIFLALVAVWMVVWIVPAVIHLSRSGPPR